MTTRRMRPHLFAPTACVALSFLAPMGCAAVSGPAGEPRDEEPPRSVQSAITALGTYDPGTPAVLQPDDWSCSIASTTWALRAVGYDVSFAAMVNAMSPGRVTSSLGLLDSSGKGILATLDEIVEASDVRGNLAVASWSDITSRAGTMSVAIGGRGWYHWSGVRSYDASKNVLRLANPAPGYKGVYQELSYASFVQLGSFSMVWLGPGPFQAAARPVGGAFEALDIASRLSAGQWVAQCTDDQKQERIWQTIAGGAAVGSRWASAKYHQAVIAPCGVAKSGIHPVVLRSAVSGQLEGTTITQCAGAGDERVYVVDAVVDNHPAASFVRVQPSATCPKVEKAIPDVDLGAVAAPSDGQSGPNEAASAGSPAETSAPTSDDASDANASNGCAVVQRSRPASGTSGLLLLHVAAFVALASRRIARIAKRREALSRSVPRKRRR